jgi:hypothetical protein
MSGKITMSERGRRTQSQYNCEQIMTGKTTGLERGRRTQSQYNYDKTKTSVGNQ